MKTHEVAVVLLLIGGIAIVAMAALGPRPASTATFISGSIGTPNEANNHGEWDIPEGATPLPSPDPEAAALGVPLIVDRLDIPLDHTGPYAIEVGEAVLPNGYLTEKRLTVANSDDGSYLTWEIWLELRPASDATPFPDNVYYKGLVNGPQRVVAFITFDLESFRPSAVMRLRDIVVR